MALVPRSTSNTSNGTSTGGARLLDTVRMEVRAVAAVGHELWVAEKDGTISIRDIHTGAELLRIPLSKESTGVFINCLLLTSDRVWTGCTDGYIRLYDPASKLLMKEFTPGFTEHCGEVQCMFAHDGKVYSGTNDCRICQWDSRTATFSRVFVGHTSYVLSLYCQGPLLYSGSEDGQIIVWDIDTGFVAHTLRSHKQGVTAMVKSANRLWTASKDGEIVVWDTDASPPAVVKAISAHKARVNCLLDLGTKICAGSSDRTIGIFEASTYRLLGRLTDHSAYVNTLTRVSKTEIWKFWSTSNDKFCRIWEIEGNPQTVVELDESRAARLQELYELVRMDMSKVESKLKATQQSIQAKDEEVAAANSRVADWETKLIQMNATLRSKDEEIKLQKQAQAKLATELADQQARNSELNQKILTVQDEVRQRDTTIEGLRNELSVNRTEMDKMADRIRRLEIDVAREQRNNAEHQSQMQAKEALIGDLQKQVGVERAAVSEASTRIGNLQTEVMQLKLDIESKNKLEISLKNANAELACAQETLRASYASLDEQVKTAVRERMDANKQLALVQEELTRLRMSDELRPKQEEAQQKKLSTVTQELTTTKDELAKVKAELEQVRGTVAGLSTQKELLNKTVGRLEAELNDERSQLVTVKSSLSMAELKRSELTTEQARLQALTEREEETRATLAKERQQWYNERAAMEDEFEKNLEKARQETRAAVLEREKVVGELKKAADDGKRAEAELQSFANERTRMAKESRQLDDRVAEETRAIRTERDELRAANEKLETEIVRLTSAVQRAENLSNLAMTSERDRLSSTVARLQAENKELLDFQKKITAERKEANMGVAQLQVEADTLRGEKQYLADECQRFQAEVDQLRTELRAAQMELSNAAAKVVVVRPQAPVANSLHMSAMSSYSKASMDADTSRASELAEETNQQLTAQLEELKKQYDEVVQSKESVENQQQMFQFVINSRVELVTALWALHTMLTKLNRKCKDTERLVGRWRPDRELDSLAKTNPAANSVLEKQTDFRTRLLFALEEAKNTVRSVEDKASYIISNYLTHYEKLQHGISPYYFHPDHTRPPVVGAELLDKLRSVTPSKRYIPTDVTLAAGTPLEPLDPNRPVVIPDPILYAYTQAPHGQRETPPPRSRAPPTRESPHSSLLLGSGQPTNRVLDRMGRSPSPRAQTVLSTVTRTLTPTPPAGRPVSSIVATKGTPGSTNVGATSLVQRTHSVPVHDPRRQKVHIATAKERKRNASIQLRRLSKPLEGAMPCCPAPPMNSPVRGVPGRLVKKSRRLVSTTPAAAPVTPKKDAIETTKTPMTTPVPATAATTASVETKGPEPTAKAEKPESSKEAEKLVESKASTSSKEGKLASTTSSSSTVASPTKRAASPGTAAASRPVRPIPKRPAPTTASGSGAYMKATAAAKAKVASPKKGASSQATKTELGSSVATLSSSVPIPAQSISSPSPSQSQPPTASSGALPPKAPHPPTTGPTASAATSTTITPRTFAAGAVAGAILGTLPTTATATPSPAPSATPVVSSNAGAATSSVTTTAFETAKASAGTTTTTTSSSAVTEATTAAAVQKQSSSATVVETHSVVTTTTSATSSSTTAMEAVALSAATFSTPTTSPAPTPAVMVVVEGPFTCVTEVSRSHPAGQGGTATSTESVAPTASPKQS